MGHGLLLNLYLIILNDWLYSKFLGNNLPFQSNFFPVSWVFLLPPSNLSQLSTPLYVSVPNTHIIVIHLGRVTYVKLSHTKLSFSLKKHTDTILNPRDYTISNSPTEPCPQAEYLNSLWVSALFLCQLWSLCLFPSLLTVPSAIIPISCVMSTNKLACLLLSENSQCLLVLSKNMLNVETQVYFLSHTIYKKAISEFIYTWSQVKALLCFLPLGFLSLILHLYVALVWIHNGINILLVSWEATNKNQGIFWNLKGQISKFYMCRNHASVAIKASEYSLFTKRQKYNKSKTMINLNLSLIESLFFSYTSISINLYFTLFHTWKLYWVMFTQYNLVD